MPAGTEACRAFGTHIEKRLPQKRKPFFCFQLSAKDNEGIMHLDALAGINIESLDHAIVFLWKRLIKAEGSKNR